MRSYTQLPDIPKGYPIDGDWFIAIPESSTNLITNPSFETATTNASIAVGASLARSEVFARRGLWSLAVTPSSSNFSGVEYAQTGLTTSQVYTLSWDVRGAPGVPYTCRVVNMGTSISRIDWIGTGRWQRLSLSFVAPATSLSFYFLKPSTTSTATFYLDGLQLEAKSYATTYFDGDSKGYIPTVAHFFWAGVPHASSSTRSGMARAGGRLMNLKNYGFYITALLGLGMITPTHIATPSALIGGSHYQRTITPSRNFALIGQFLAGSPIERSQLQNDLVEALRHDAVEPNQPLLLRYRPGSLEEHEDLVYDLTSVYSGGLAGQIDNNYGLTATLAFTMYLPMIRSSDERGVELDFQDTVTNGDNGFLLRSPAGAWSAHGTGIAGAGTVGIYALAHQAQSNALFVGGSFTTGMNGIANTAHLAKWDGSTWSSITPSGSADDIITAMAISPNGVLYVGGAFANIDGVAATRIAKWDGTTWTALGTGVNGIVRAIEISYDGTVYVGGDFTLAGGVANTNRIAKWDGSNWTALGTGGNEDVLALELAADGTTLYAGGQFTTMGGTSTAYIAKWNGSAWSALSTGMSDMVEDLQFGPDGLLYIGGRFVTAGGTTVNYVTAWNGTSFKSLGGGFNNIVQSLAFDANGLLYAAGTLYIASGYTHPTRVAVWNGSVWLPVDVNVPIADATSIQTILVRPDQSVAVGFFNVTTTTLSAGQTTVPNNAQASVHPKIIVKGGGYLYVIKNYTTGKAIYFPQMYIRPGETVTLQLDPQQGISFESSYRGNVLNYILAGSNITDFTLIPGNNIISVLMNGTDSTTDVEMTWRESHHSILTGY